MMKNEGKTKKFKIKEQLFTFKRFFNGDESVNGTVERNSCVSCGIYELIDSVIYLLIVSHI